MFAGVRALASLFGVLSVICACSRPPGEPRQNQPPLIKDLEVLRPVVLVAYTKAKISVEPPLSPLGSRFTLFPTIVIPTGQRRLSRICALVGNSSYFGNQVVSPSHWAEGRNLPFVNGSYGTYQLFSQLYKDHDLQARNIDPSENAYSFDKRYLREEARHWLLEFEDGTHAVLAPLDVAGLSTAQKDLIVQFRLADKPDFVDAYLRDKYFHRFKLMAALNVNGDPMKRTDLVALRQELESYRAGMLQEPFSLIEAKRWFDSVFLTSRMLELQERLFSLASELELQRKQLNTLKVLETEVTQFIDTAPATKQPDFELARVVDELPSLQERVKGLAEELLNCEQAFKRTVRELDGFGTWNTVLLVGHSQN